MHKQTATAIAYVQNALSFIFSDGEIPAQVRKAYVYGSAVRGKLTAQSDIDVFLDCNARNEQDVERRAKSACSRFYQSKDFEKWKLFKFTYPLSIHAGDVKTWELKTSVMAEGILLYSKEPEITDTKRATLFTLTLPRKKKQYLQFTRAVFGRREKGYKEHGLLSILQGKKLSSTVMLIPQEHQQRMMDFLNKEKMNYAMKEVCLFD